MQETLFEIEELTKKTTSGLPVVSETLVTMIPRSVGIENKRNIFESAFFRKREVDETAAESLFEHFAWLYILCREKLFKDDTDRIIQSLWPTGKPAADKSVIELGCGPGFYSSRIAARFPLISVLGIDSSESQLNWARARAKALKIKNCSYKRLNVLALSCDDSTFDALIASRLFTVLPHRERAIAEMFRVLQPGGRCFIAEPRGFWRASIPLFSMWLLASVTRFKNGYREPSKATVLSSAEFERLFNTQPWREINIWQDGRYQYALCEKG